MRFDATAAVFALFTVVLCVWLGIFGPLTEVKFEAKDWLGFAGNAFGGVATFVAALIAWHAVKRQIISAQLIADRNARPWVSIMGSHAFSFTVGHMLGVRVKIKTTD
jgi:fumarate reductase subunit D